MINYYKDKNFPFFKLKHCKMNNQAETPHYHDEISISLVLKGETEVIYNNKKYIFKKDDLIIIPNSIVHSCIPKNNQIWEFDLIYLDKSWFNDNFNFKFNEDILYSKLSKKEINIFKEFIDLLKNNNEDKEELIINLFESIDLTNLNFKIIDIKSPSDRELKDINDYIVNNYNQKLKLDDLSKMIGYSKYTLLREFKKNYGLTPLLYQRNIRCNLAKKMLEKKQTIAEIGIELGYYDQSHFTSDFAKFNGITPKKYRSAIFS